MMGMRRTRQDIHALADLYESVDALEEVNRFEDAPDVSIHVKPEKVERFDRLRDFGWIHVTGRFGETYSIYFDYSGYAIGRYVSHVRGTGELEGMTVPEIVKKAGAKVGLKLK